MKRVALRPQDRRALIIGAVIVIPSLLYTFAIVPGWRALRARQADVVRERDALARDQLLIQRAPHLEAQRTQTVAWLKTEERRLFAGADDIAATSGLTNYVTNAADDAHVQVRQTETRPSVAFPGSLRALRLNVRAEGNAREVLRFLEKLEGGDQLVRIGQITIGHIGGGFAGPLTPATATAALNALRTPANASQRLAMTAEVYGYALIPTPREVRVLAEDAGGEYVPLGKTTAEPIDLSNAIAHNPFSADRGASLVPQPRQPVAPPPFPIRLVGTVVGQPGAGFAMCEVNSNPPTLIRPGDYLAGYTLRDVARGSIVLVGQDGKTVRLTVTTPGA